MGDKKIPSTVGCKALELAQYGSNSVEIWPRVDPKQQNLLGKQRHLVGAYLESQ